MFTSLNKTWLSLHRIYNTLYVFYKCWYGHNMPNIIVGLWVGAGELDTGWNVRPTCRNVLNWHVLKSKFAQFRFLICNPKAAHNQQGNIVPGESLWAYAIFQTAISGQWTLAIASMTSSTRLEIHYLLHCRQRLAELRPQAACTKNVVKFGHEHTGTR